MQGDLFKIELLNFLDHSHLLIKLVRTVDWARLVEAFGKLYCERARELDLTAFQLI